MSHRSGAGRRSFHGDREGGDRRDAVDGTVVAALPNDMFTVELSNGEHVLGHVPASARIRMVRIVPGDRVALELSPYDPTRGRITHRYR